ncbi:RING finger protein nhl-1 [Holothuria leucospilota]|uniref:RING finger protein nhl-1 n=1 Tax=Holothuria leucospilota TaxID=206669 RepID=A0A9Q1C3A5_HOLLE|nr:RING finger protein nhl-1 [Holothuria leucospilota]
MAQRMEDVQMSVICAICLEVWTRPKTLPCDHVFCEECLEKISTSNGRWIRCPECRKLHMVPVVGIRDSWPTQRALNNVADSLRKKDFQNPAESSPQSPRVFPPTKAKPTICNSWSSQDALNNATHGLRNMDLQDSAGPSPRSSGVLPRTKAKPLIAPKPSFPIPKSADPLRSYVEKQNFQRIKVGDKFAVIVQLCDRNGQVMAAKSGKENLTAFVDLKPSPRGFHKEEIKPSLTREGKYAIEYQAKRCGIHIVSILFQNETIQGSPVSIPVGPRGIRGCEIIGPLSCPLDAAEYHGKFLVTDSFSKAVFLIDHAGREIKKLNVPENMKQKFLPMAITTFENRMLVTDPGNKCAHVYQNLDDSPRPFGSPYLQLPMGIAVSRRNGDIFIVDECLRQILVFRSNLQFVQAISGQSFSSSSEKQGKQYLQNPSMMTINMKGDKLYIVDRAKGGNDCIKIMNVCNNTFERNINITCFHKLARPFGVSLDQDENIFVSVKIETKNISSGYIVIFNSEGKYLGNIKSLKHQRLVSPFGLFVSSSPGGMPSVIYVVDGNLEKPGDCSLKGFII